MLKKTALLLFVCCATPLFAQGQQSATPDSALIRKVDDHYNHLTSLRAHYTEHYTGMGMDRTESGTLLLKKPGRMRWNYDKPVGKVFVLDGKYAWFYTPGDSQAQRVPAKELDDLRSPLRFLLGHTQLKKELDNLTVTPDGAGFRITGVPKGMAQRVKLLTLQVTSAGAIQQMQIEELDGSITGFTFSEIQENIPVKGETFVFHPPAGVIIVNGLPPI
ncbi:outer membrane lipoprotein chaperone LolA [Edaphobacter paludis]|uniref:Outer-membrane lipoprotein carrier protein n=1 Tax=Edaphobacter paludis TaxID=3035702 RepID=A0AAU7D3Z1_9BACT